MEEVKNESSGCSEIIRDDIIREAPLGKGLAGTLNFSRGRGDLKVIVEGDGQVKSLKDAYRKLSHRFHGKESGIKKQEKRRKQFNEDQTKICNMPLVSVERMKEAQLRSKSPYLVISGPARVGKTSDPQSGFGTIEKDLPRNLVPLQGDRKIDNLMGVKRKASRPGDMGPPRKQKNGNLFLRK